jgi:hypothetical protein
MATQSLGTLASMVDSRSPDQPLSARTAARLLFGAIGLVAARHGVGVMQSTCAELVACDAAWATRFGTLPRGADGRVAEPMVLISGMARGILPMAGAERLQAALAFWASEQDPAVWQAMAPSD